MTKRQEQKEFTKQRHLFWKSAAWKEFRQMLIESRGHYCELCGREAKKGLQVHHDFHYENIKDYTDLRDAAKFKLVCRQCHTLLERCGEERLKTIAENLLRRK